jgi:2Fe-2S ferredoxin
MTASDGKRAETTADVNITFILNDGSSRAVACRPCQSLMQAAVSAGIPGIEGDCGGNCVCGTCLISSISEQALPPVQTAESEMLQFLAQSDRRARLACQIPVDESVDGLVVQVAGLI